MATRRTDRKRPRREPTKIGVRKRAGKKALIRKAAQRADVARITREAEERYREMVTGYYMKRKGLAEDVARAVTDAHFLDKKRIRKARALSYIDPLTGLHNRRYLDAVLEAEKRLAKEHGHRYPFTALSIDLDHFKFVNDKLGHDAGDVLLKEVATVLKSSIRKSDEVMRIGGEEFVVILRGSRIKGAHRVASRIRRKLRSLKEDRGFVHPTNRGGRVTASIGYAQYNPARNNVVIQDADGALYKAKVERDMAIGAKFPRPRRVRRVV